jgi:arabinose-5-phosphate isomerase
MITGERIPVVPVASRVLDAVMEMDSKRVGATLVSDDQGKLVGILTDGDLRRALLRRGDIGGLAVQEIMSPRPKTIDENSTAADALAVMERNGIMHLAIVDADWRVRGLLHLHDILGREEFRINGGGCGIPAGMQR